MSIKRFRQGEKITSFPTQSWNTMAEVVERLQNTLGEIIDHRSPRDKSPVVVQLLWAGETALEPGNCVKLGTALFDPDTHESAPFSGLQFNCDEFASAEALADYAITMGQIAGGGAGIGYGVIPQAYWAKVLVSDAGHTHAGVLSTGTVLGSAASGGLRVIWKPSGTGEKWCVVSMGGGIGDHYQIVRGVTTAAVDVADVAFQIEAIAAYEQFSSAPDEPLWVKAPADGVTLAVGDAVWAIWRENVLTFDPGSGSVQVDWLMFEPGSSNTPPLREFALQAAKDKDDVTASVKWLDHTQSEIGDAVTVYDPDASTEGGRFSGKAVNYVGTERAFRGLALLRTDLAAETADRWEIIAMERFAEWAVVAYNQSAGTYHLATDAFGGDEWNRRRPVANGAALTISDPAALVGRTLADGEKLLVRLLNPDTPTYQIHGVRNEDRRVASSSVDTAPLSLIDKLHNTGVYDDETERLVKFEEFNDGGVRRVRASVQIDDFGTSVDNGVKIAYGRTTAAVDPIDTTFLIELAYNLDGIGVLADPLTIQNQLGKAYEEAAFIFAAKDVGAVEWKDITPSEGEVINAIVEVDIPAAAWNDGTRTLTPGSFLATWLHRDATIASPNLVEGAIPISIDVDNCSEHSFDYVSEPLFVKLRWESGVWSLIWNSPGGGGKRVRGQVVGNINHATATFTIDNLTEVYGGTPPASPLTVQQTYAQGYVDNQLTEAIFNEDTGLWENLPLPRKLGCHLGITAAGFEYVDATTLAGTGLSYETGAGGCQVLKVSGSIAVAEGYCIELEDLATDKIHLDQITSSAGVQATGIDTAQFQFWVHAGDAAARTDAKWVTATGYSGSATQLLGQISGVWHCKTIEEWLKLIPTWSASVAQFLVHKPSEDPKWLSPEEALKLLGGWSSGALQSIGHNAATDPAWQADDDVCP